MFVLYDYVKYLVHVKRDFLGSLGKVKKVIINDFLMSVTFWKYC